MPLGCPGAQDKVTHYLECPGLWGVAPEALKEDPQFDFTHRLGLIGMDRNCLDHSLLSTAHAMERSMIHFVFRTPAFCIDALLFILGLLGWQELHSVSCDLLFSSAALVGHVDVE